MNSKISNNLNEIINNNIVNDKANTTSKQGFDKQERDIYIYKCKDFFKLNRATINEKDNQRFLWSCEFFKKRKCYVLEETRPQRNTFLNVKAVGSNVEFFVNMDEIFETENDSLIFSFKELNNESKMEEIYFITSMRNLMGSEQVSYEYNLSALNTLSLGSGSQLKLLFDVPNDLQKNIKSIIVKPNNKRTHFLGFDCNVSCFVENIFPVWHKIINIDNSSIDYRNLWENDKWLLSWEELDKVRDGDKIDLEKIFLQNDKVFTPALNLLKKIITLNISYINNFTQTADITVNQVGENAGEFWKSTLLGKSTEEVSNILNSYIDAEIKIWKTGSYRDEIKGNFPFGEIKAFPEGLSYDNNLVKKFFAVLTMLGTQIISNRSFFFGRNEASKFLLPYYFVLDESKFIFNSDYNLTTLTDINILTIESNYFILNYPVFTTEQIKEFNETGEVSNYKYDIRSESDIKKYGEINPFLDVGDEALKLTKIRENKISHRTTWLRNRLNAFDISIGWNNNPLVCFITDYDIEIISHKELGVGYSWTEAELSNYNVLPVSISYSTSTFYDNSPSTKIVFGERNSRQVKSVSFNDVLQNNKVAVGMITDGGSNPTAEKLVEIERINGTEILFGFTKNIMIENPFYNRIKEIVDDVNSNDDKFFIGTPKVNFFIQGYHEEEGFTDFSDYSFSVNLTIDCLIGEFNREILKRVSEKRNITIEELERKIRDSQEPQLITNDLVNDGLFIELLEQDVQLQKPNENLEEENYITLPSGYTEGIENTWVYYPVEKITLDKFLSYINEEREIENENNEIRINLRNYTEVKLEKLFLYYLNYSDADIEILYGKDNLTYDFKIRLGDKTDSSVSLSTLVFKEEEED